MLIWKLFFEFGLNYSESKIILIRKREKLILNDDDFPIVNWSRLIDFRTLFKLFNANYHFGSRIIAIWIITQPGYINWKIKL